MTFLEQYKALLLQLQVCDYALAAIPKHLQNPSVQALRERKRSEIIARIAELNQLFKNKNNSL